MDEAYRLLRRGSLSKACYRGFISIIQLLKKTDGKAGRLLSALIRVPLLVLQRRWLLTELMEQPIYVDQ